MKHRAVPLQEIPGITSYLNQEKKRGIVTSIASGAISTGLNYLGVIALGMNPLLSTAIFLNLFGSLFSYSLDILFAKTHFRIHKTQTVVAVPFSHLGVRSKWLIRSFKKPQFMRFIIVVIIESLTVLTIIAALIREFDNREWAMKYRDVRNFLIALAAGIIVFFMFGNMLRFDWAYTEDGSLHLTTSMLMWMSLSVMVFCLSGPGSNINSNSNINSDVKNKDDVKN